MKTPTIIGTPGRLGLIVVSTILFALLLHLSIGAANAQTWFSLQEGDVRTGSDWTTVNTNGTLLTAEYTTSVTYIRGSSPGSNYNVPPVGQTNYWLGTGVPSGQTNRLLLAWDLTLVANSIGGKAFVVSGAKVNLTQFDNGQNDASGMAICRTTGTFYDESVATWTNVGPGQAAGGTVAATIVNPVQTSVGSISPFPAQNGPRVMTWTNVGINNVIGTALANPTNKTAYFLIKRNNESSPGGYFHPIVTDENTALYHSDLRGDDYGGIDSRPELLVTVTILSNAPLVSVSAATNETSENSATPSVFTISRTVNLTNDVTVTFRFRNEPTLGDAQNGIDFTASESGSVTLPANVASTNIFITPSNDSDVEDDENIILTIFDSTGTNYGIADPTATIVLHDDGDAQTLVDYMFGYGTAPHVWDTNVTATLFASPRFPFALGGTVQSISVPSAVYVNGFITPNSEDEALTNTPASYAATTLTPAFGHVLTLTNIQFASEYLTTSDPGTPAESVWFIRSSLNDYTTTLAAFTNPVTFFRSFTPHNLELGPEFANLGNVTFRFYIYDDTTYSATLTYIEDLFFFGQTAPLAAGQQQIAITASSPNATEPATPGAFTITRTTNDMTAALNVSYTLSGTATNGVDYTSLSGTANIPAGTNIAVVSVAPLSDALVEGNETVIMTLQSAPNVIVWGAGSATVTIADSGATPAAPQITRIAVVGSNVEIQFSAGAGDVASAFHLQSSATVNGTYNDDNSANITGGGGAFQATTTVSGDTHFYRIRR